MTPATMQKLVADQCVQRWRCWYQPQLKRTELVDIIFFDSGTGFTPALSLCRCPDNALIVLQVLIELPVHQKTGCQPVFVVSGFQLLKMLQVINPVSRTFKLYLPLQVVFVRRRFKSLQIMFEVLLNGLLLLSAVATLVEQEH